MRKGSIVPSTRELFIFLLAMLDRRTNVWPSGASGIGGFINGPVPPRIADNKARIFIFGRSGFFGYASASPTEAKILMWWSTFETDSLPSKTNPDAEEIRVLMLCHSKHQENVGRCQRPALRLVSKGRCPEGVGKAIVDLTSGSECSGTDFSALPLAILLRREGVCGCSIARTTTLCDPAIPQAAISPLSLVVSSMQAR